MHDFKKFSLSVSTKETFISKLKSRVEELTIVWRVTIENNSIVQNAMVSDAGDDVNLIMEKDTAESEISSNTLNAGDSDEEADPFVTLPSFAEKVDLVYKLESISYDFHVPVAVYFLHKVKTALLTAKEKSEPEYGGQLLILKMLEKYFVSYLMLSIKAFLRIRTFIAYIIRVPYWATPLYLFDAKSKNCMSK